MDYYSILGVTKNASPDEIKKAYRKLASQHHPDKGGDTATFQKVEEAYRILGDPQKRQHYDSPPSSGFGNFEFSQSFNPEDIFSHIFGQHFQHPFTRRQQKQMFRTQISITLEDVYKGTTQTMKVQTPTEQKIISIEIPKGVKEKSQIRYDNVIDNAVLIVEFKINPHLKYERRENDLYSNVSISVLDLIVGTTINFTTISGKDFEVTVPPKTQPYMQLKILGQGMPIQGTGLCGDQILCIKPFIPDRIDDAILQSILMHRNK